MIIVKFFVFKSFVIIFESELFVIIITTKILSIYFEVNGFYFIKP